MKIIKYSLAAFLVLFAVSVLSNTIRVPSQYATIQEAINNAQVGDTILVADGIYYEEINFNGNVADSAIIRSESGSDACIIDCQDGAFSTGFIFNSEDCKSTIEGFTIRNATMGIWAYANSAPVIKNNIIQNCEIGIYCSSDAAPLILSNEIYDCNNQGNGFSEFGGGISSRYASPVIKQNKISGNLGGGIYCEESSPVIIGNEILLNQLDYDIVETMTCLYDNHQRPDKCYISSLSTQGAGISINKSTSAIIQNNIVYDNYANFSGGIYCDSTSHADIINNSIIENSSKFGGGMLVESSSSRIINNIVTGNKGPHSWARLARWFKNDLLLEYTYDGAKIDYITYYFGFINNGETGDVEISGCTGLNRTITVEKGERVWIEVQSNVTEYGQGGGLNVSISLGNSIITLNYTRTDQYYTEHGCIIIQDVSIVSYGDESHGITGAGIVLKNEDNIPEIANNNVYGNTGNNYVFNDSTLLKSAQVFDLTGTNGNISFDPLVDEDTYELKEGSPCIDAGTTDITGLGIGETDFSGNPRISDGDGNGTAIIDIGAIEYQLQNIETEEYVSICQGEEYEGRSETETFQRILTAVSGVDSIVTTYLTVNPTYESEEYVSICEGEDYLGITEEGDHSRQFETVQSCDSIVVTHLTVNPAYFSEEYISICEGDNYLGLTEEGDHQREFETVNSCDSIIVTHLTVNPTYSFEESVTICEGETYKGWNTEGQHIENLVSVSECDSIVITNLSFYASYQPEINNDRNTLSTPNLYQSYQWFKNDGTLLSTESAYTISESGNYYLVVTDENGCTNTSAIFNVVYTSVNEISFETFKFSIIPNPNSGKFSFKINSNPPEQVTLKLINTLGQVLEMRQLDKPEINQTEQFNVSHLSKGIYHLIITFDKLKINEKIVVQ